MRWSPQTPANPSRTIGGRRCVRGSWEKDGVLCLPCSPACDTGSWLLWNLFVAAEKIECGGQFLTARGQSTPSFSKVVARTPHAKCNYVTKAGSKQCWYHELLTLGSISAPIVGVEISNFGGGRVVVFVLPASFPSSSFYCVRGTKMSFWIFFAVLLHGKRILNAAPTQNTKI